MDAEQPSSLEQNAVDSPYVFLSYSSLDLDFALPSARVYATTACMSGWTVS
jgi:hypothetical protein